jgi:hypothetical protein
MTSLLPNVMSGIQRTSPKEKETIKSVLGMKAKKILQ